MSRFCGLRAVRPWPVYLLAASVPLSMAATSIAKVTILLTALVLLLASPAVRMRASALDGLKLVPVVLLMLACLALSLTWTVANAQEALITLVKYGKLLVIPAILVVLRTRKEALTAMGCYLAAQAFVVLTSVFLGLGAPLPWVPAVRNSVATVYSSYLDQSIMTAGFAAMCWHLRKEFPGKQAARWGALFAVLAIFNVVVQLPGRSGYLACFVVLALALFWMAPARGRLPAMLAPFLLMGIAYAFSPQIQQRVAEVEAETASYTHGNVMTSSGLRLFYWKTSFQAIVERPLTGYGAGSWAHEFKRVNSGRDTSFSGTGGNPHQEYLLWGMHLGVPGILLLLGFFSSVILDGRRLPMAERHGLWSVVAVLATVCLFNSTLYDALIGDYFCMLIGVLLAIGLHRVEAPKAIPREVPA